MQKMINVPQTIQDRETQTSEGRTPLGVPTCSQLIERLMRSAVLSPIFARTPFQWLSIAVAVATQLKNEPNCMSKSQTQQMAAETSLKKDRGRQKEARQEQKTAVHSCFSGL